MCQPSLTFLLRKKDRLLTKVGNFLELWHIF